MWIDSETDIDFLDFEYLKNIIIDIIKNDELSPSSIGIFGDWGSGKSSLMQMCINELQDDDTILCITFNGWLFEGYEDTKTALLGSILDQISDKKSTSQEIKDAIKELYQSVDKLKLAKMGIKYGIDFFLTGGLGTISTLTCQSLISNIKEKGTNLTEEDIKKILRDENPNDKLRENIKSFHDNFEKLLEKTSIRRLVVFIDELDRCNPDTIIETLEGIRLFLFAKNSSFIIGADERQVIYAIKKRYPEINEMQLEIGKEYLEKIIQYPIRIPQLSQREVEYYILCLFFKKDLSNDEFNEILEFIHNKKKGKDFFDFNITYNHLESLNNDIAIKSKEAINLAKQLSPVLADGLNGNPRNCKRFLNSLSMREKMALFREIDIDRRILAKIMLLEYFRPLQFKELAGIQARDKGKPNDIEMIEKESWEDVTDLKSWKKDKWIINWIQNDPKLSDHDLRPYFYFSRESVTRQLNLIPLNLNPDAEEILIKLLKGGEILRKDAINKAKSLSLSDYEKITILNKIIEKFLSDSKLNIELFRSLLEWGADYEILHLETLNCLKMLDCKRLDITFIPPIEKFLLDTKMDSEIKEIVIPWAKINKTLSVAIKSHFGEEK